ncbi:MAG: tetratricopeptide repeat protein, partial [Nannocystaceae bacterium]
MRERAGEHERRLVRAITAAEARHLAQARREVEAALALPGIDAAQAIAAAAVLFVVRDYRGCFACLDRAAERPGAFRRAIEDRVAYASSLGWDQEAREALERAIAREPEEPTWAAHMTRLLVRAGAHERALVHAGRALELAERSPRMRMEVAHLLAEVGQIDEARRMVHRALEVAPRGARLFLVGAAEILANTGDVAGATALLRRILAADPDDAGLWRRCADLSLWTGDFDGAARDLERAAALEPKSPALARLRGVLAR